MAHEWHPIEDLADFGEPVHDETCYLAEVWHKQKPDFDPKQVLLFNERLNREWAIETGLIERVYNLDRDDPDRGITRLLIERGISEQLIPKHSGDHPGKTAAMLRDHKNVVEGLLDFVGSQRELSVSYIKELHAALLQNQETVDGVDMLGNETKVPLSHGKFKTMRNDPAKPSGEIHYYCPPEHVDGEMDRLIAMYKEHVERDVPPLVGAAWLHHRFTQIHPFQDGNGRVARSLASLVFIKAEWFPLVIRNEIHGQYLDALAAADNGNLSELINLFADVQKKFFVDALEFCGKESAHDAQTEAIIKSAAEKMNRSLRSALTESYEAAEKTAGELAGVAKQRLEKLQSQIKKDFPDNDVRVYFSPDKPRNRDKSGIAAIGAEQLGYQPNFRAYSASIYLTITAQISMHMFFHGFGTEYRGVIACSAFLWVEGRLHSLNDVFQIDYKESLEKTRERFDPWLEKAILAGLARWRDIL